VTVRPPVFHSRPTGGDGGRIARRRAAATLPAECTRPQVWRGVEASRSLPGAVASGALGRDAGLMSPAGVEADLEGESSVGRASPQPHDRTQMVQ
jgi:hypothetical protein